MPFPLRLKEGHRAYFKPGPSANSHEGRDVIVLSVGRLYITDDFGRRYRIADGRQHGPNASGRLWSSRDEYEVELAAMNALLRLKRGIERLAQRHDAARPSLERVTEAAALLGIDLETRP